MDPASLGPAILTSASLGVTWGWLLVLLRRQRRAPARDAVSTLATALVAGETLMFCGWPGLMAFVVAAAAAAWVHAGWLQQLRRARQS